VPTNANIVTLPIFLFESLKLKCGGGGGGGGDRAEVTTFIGFHGWY